MIFYFLWQAFWFLKFFLSLNEYRLKGDGDGSGVTKKNSCEILWLLQGSNPGSQKERADCRDVLIQYIFQRLSRAFSFLNWNLDVLEVKTVVGRFPPPSSACRGIHRVCLHFPLDDLSILVLVVVEVFVFPWAIEESYI